MTKTKKEMFIGFLAIFVLVLGMGLVSYAAFSYSKAGEKVNTITTGTIQMSTQKVITSSVLQMPYQRQTRLVKLA